MLAYLFALFCLSVLPPTEAQPPAVRMEVHEGGGRQAPPHPVIITICSDGLVKTTRGEFLVEPARVQKLVDQLARLGAFRLSSGDLQDEVIRAGEAPAGIRGGSGVYTLRLTRGEKTVTVRLNQPDMYAETKVRSVRVFQKA
ncbi:MAG: hypothetical protein NZ741_11990, partial [Armatimonadetes bacterium]|nr:hypothetical protein [Armatimonadota bacterium]